MNRQPPYDFIFDYLLPIHTTVKPFFGMFYVYSGPKLLLILRERDDQREMNGIWVPTNKAGFESLRRELPVLRHFPGPEKSTKTPAYWLVIPPEEADFERAAIRVCEMIVRRDARIGRMPG